MVFEVAFRGMLVLIFVGYLFLVYFDVFIISVIVFREYTFEIYIVIWSFFFYDVALVFKLFVVFEIVEVFYVLVFIFCFSVFVRKNYLLN